MEFDSLSNNLIGCALEVHRVLGPGLLESTYEQCLAYELSKLGLSFVRQVSMPVSYKQVKLDCGYKIDLLVEDKIVVELKSVEYLLPVHKAQILTYMKLSQYPIGLLINFNEKLLKQGIKRFVL